MQTIYPTFIKKILFFSAIILFTAQLSRAQAVYIPYTYQLYQKFNSEVYSPDNSLHTALKPYLLDSSITRKYNEILNRGVDSNRKSWISREFFNEHLIHKETNEYTLYADYLTDMEVGRDLKNNITTAINTKGYQIGGTIGDKFFFYSSGYENQEKFPEYVYDYIKEIGFVPGEAYDRDIIHPKSSPVDWSYSTAIISYTPIKELNITLGEDKTFIGDGYRSLLLSDYSASYPLLRLTANVGKVQYMMMWANLEDINLPKFDTYGNNRRKWAAFHYLDWNATNKLSLGFFNALIAADANDQGQRHPFDFNYVNPVLFASSLGSSYPYKDNVLAGFTGKYKVFKNGAVYAQLIIDRFKASDFFSSSGGLDNTNGYQVGIRGADLFNVKGFNYLLEYNTVKPYTYAGQQSISSYTDYSESLADPLGANFKEGIAILDYSVGQWDFQGQANIATYGLDITGQNNGQDVTLPLPTGAVSASTGQGLRTHMYYGEGTISYLINPKYNFRVFGGTVLRQESNSSITNKTAWITFGLKSSFRNMYHDF